MAYLEKGTEGKETVAPLKAQGGANEASRLNAFARNSRGLCESEEDGARDKDSGQDAREGAARKLASSDTSHSRAPLLLVAWGVGMAVGLGTGWFGHELQAKKETYAADKGTGDEATEPCKAWTDTICGRMGELAYECTHARAARALLSDSACVQAQESVLAKLDAIKADRVLCNELTRRLCSDLGPEGKGCEFMKAKEPAFSSEECQDMTKDYKRVLANVMTRQTKGTIPRPPGVPRNLTIMKPN